MFNISKKALTTLSIFVACIFTSSCGNIPGPSLAGGGSPGAGSGASGAPADWLGALVAARAMRKKGNGPETEKLYVQAVEGCKKKKGEEDLETAMCLEELADFYRETQDWRKAFRTYKEHIKIVQKLDPQRDMTILRKNFKIVKAKIKEYHLEDKEPVAAESGKTEAKSDDSDSK